MVNKIIEEFEEWSSRSEGMPLPQGESWSPVDNTTSWHVDQNPGLFEYDISNTPSSGEGRYPLLISDGDLFQGWGPAGRAYGLAARRWFAPASALNWLSGNTWEDRLQKTLEEHRDPNKWRSPDVMQAELEAGTLQTEWPEEDYDGLKDIRFFELPEQFHHLSLESRSSAETSIIIEEVHKLLENDRIINDSGIVGTFGALTGALVSDIPLFALGGTALLVGAPTTFAAQEFVLHKDFPQKSIEESMAIVVGGTAVVGAITGLQKAFGPPRGNSNIIIRKFDDEVGGMEQGSNPVKSSNSVDPKDPEVFRRTEEFQSAKTELDELIEPQFLALEDATAKEVGEAYLNASNSMIEFWKDMVTPTKETIEASFELNTFMRFHEAMDDLDVIFKANNITANTTRLRNAADQIKRPVIMKGLTPSEVFQELIYVNDREGVRNALDVLVEAEHITAKSAISMKAVADVMPDNFFKASTYAGGKVGPEGPRIAGTYYFTHDVTAVFGLPLSVRAKKTGMKDIAGHVFAHEQGHRVFFAMATEEELKTARNLFDNFSTKPKTEEFLAKYKEKGTHFNEWFAEEFAGYWSRRVKSGKESAYSWLEGAYAKEALGLSTAFENMAIKIVNLIRKLSAHQNVPLTQDQLLDSFFGAITKRIGKKNAQSIIDDIESILLIREKRYTEGTDFLTGPKGKPGSPSEPAEIGNFTPYSYSRSELPFERDFVPTNDANRLLPSWFLEKLPDSPIKRLLESDEPFARHVASYLAEHPFYQVKNAAGKSTPTGVDRNVAVEWIAPMIDALKKTDLLYKVYRKRYANELPEGTIAAGARKSSVAQFAEDKLKGTGGALTRQEFYIEVGRAKRRLNRPDIDTSNILPEAMTAAKTWQQKLYGRAGSEAQEHKLFSIRETRRLRKVEAKRDEILESTAERGMTVKQLRYVDMLEAEMKELQKTIREANTFPLDPNFLNRLWNKSAILARRQEFESIIVKKGGYTPQEAKAKVDTILEGRAYIPISEDLTGVARSFKERQIKVDDIDVEDFLESNIANLGRYYASRVGADIELVKQFGSVDLLEVVNRIRDNFVDKINKADPKFLKEEADFLKAKRELGDSSLVLPEEQLITKMFGEAGKESYKIGRAEGLEVYKNVIKPNEKAAAIIKTRDSLIEDIHAMRDRIRGTYGIPDDPTTWTHRGIRVAKMFNAVTLLTGALAAIPDLGKLVMNDGMRRAFGTSLEAFRDGLKTVKLAKNEANIAGEALDMYLAMRSALFSDLADSLSAATPFERSAGHATQQFFNIALMNQWNVGVKTMASLITGSRIISEAEKLVSKTINKTELTKLSNIGIDESVAKIIVEQTKKHGLVGDYVRIPKTTLWDKTPEVQAASKIYTTGLGKDINRIIVTPGKGELPLFMSKPIMTLLFQFKSFAIAALHRTLTPALQLRDKNALHGMVYLIGLGAVVDQIRRHQLDIKRERPFGAWLTDVVERSGTIGIFSDLNNALETLTDNGLGFRPLMGSARPWDPSILSKLSVVGGPIVHQTTNAARVLWDVGPGDINDKTVNSARRLLYGGKLAHTNRLFDIVEGETAGLIME